MFSERLRYKYTECCRVLVITDFFLSSEYIIPHTHRTIEGLRVGRDLFRPPLNSAGSPRTGWAEQNRFQILEGSKLKTMVGKVRQNYSFLQNPKHSNYIILKSHTTLNSPELHSVLSVIPTFIIPLFETRWFRLIWCLQLLPNSGPNVLLSVCGLLKQPIKPRACSGVGAAAFGWPPSSLGEFLDTRDKQSHPCVQLICIPWCHTPKGSFAWALWKWYQAQKVVLHRKECYPTCPTGPVIMLFTQ